MAFRDPQAVCDEECQAYPIRAARLRRMHRICADGLADGRTDFSIDAVGLACAVDDGSELTGPTAGAIRNPDGAPYRRLIDAFVRAAGGVPSSKRRRREAKTAWSDDLRQAPRSVQDAFDALERLCEQRGVALRLAQADLARAKAGMAAQPEGPMVRLSAATVRAIQDAWSDATRQRLGWRIDGGRVVDEASRTVFRPGVHAVWTELVQQLSQVAGEGGEVELCLRSAGSTR